MGVLAVAAGILAAIFIPFQNASAFVADLSLPNADPSNVPKSAVGSTFLVTIDIAPGELISMSQIEIILDNETPEVKRAIFDPDGKRTSGDPNLTRGNLKIDVPSSTSYGYGYGYGSVSYGTAFSPPYSYSFTSSQDFLSGNQYGYSYAVANANLVNGFLGPATITIEGKINTALLDEGAHTLDVLVHTGSGGNDIDKIVPPQLEFNISSEEAAGPLLTVEAEDTDGNPITGVWTVIRPAEEDDNSILKLGFSPLTFVGETGKSYRITVADYDGRTFQSWEDGSTERTRTVELTDEDMTITATHDNGDSLKGFTPLTYSSDDGVHHSLTVEAVNVGDESEALTVYTIIDPQSSNESSTTYRVYMHNYLDKIFRHWEDGSQDNVRTITIEEDTTITAHYRVDDDEAISASFAAPLHGSQEVPPVSSDNDGEAIFILSEDGTELKYSLIVSQLGDVTQAHIHLAPPGQNGPIVAFLFEEANIDDPDDGVSVSGSLVRGTITSSDLIGPLEGSELSDLIEEMENGNAYVNAHTPENPGGEIRGQILSDDD